MDKVSCNANECRYNVKGFCQNEDVLEEPKDSVFTSMTVGDKYGHIGCRHAHRVSNMEDYDLVDYNMEDYDM